MLHALLGLPELKYVTVQAVNVEGEVLEGLPQAVGTWEELELCGNFDLEEVAALAGPAHAERLVVTEPLTFHVPWDSDSVPQMHSNIQVLAQSRELQLGRDNLLYVPDGSRLIQNLHDVLLALAPLHLSCVCQSAGHGCSTWGRHSGCAGSVPGVMPGQATVECGQHSDSTFVLGSPACAPATPATPVVGLVVSNL